MTAAFEQTEAEAAASSGRSVFTELGDRLPDAQPARVPKWALEALSRALEDEYSFQSRGGVVLAALQRERQYRLQERRWQALATGAELALVLADFRDPLQVASRPVEIPVGDGDALAREWVVACDCIGFTACIAAREVDGAAGRSERERVFETIWTMRSDAVRAAERALLAAAEHVLPAIRAIVPVRVRDAQAPPESTSPRARRELRARFMEYAGGTRTRRAGTPPAGFQDAWARAEGG